MAVWPPAPPSAPPSLSSGLSSAPKLVVAIPTAPPEVCAQLATEVDESAGSHLNSSSMWAAFGVDQLSYRACRSAEHAVTDRSGSRDDRAETETRKQQRVAHLADGVPRPMVQDRRERAAGGDERATVAPPDEVGRDGLGESGWIREREDDRPLRMPRHQAFAPAGPAVVLAA